MNERLWHRLITVLLTAVLISSAFSVTAFADELRAGTVAGLPEKLVVLDDKGNSVSENGEYYFEVEGMQAFEHYVKKIQIMNLREDASYHIDFRAEPISKSGEIDLEEECNCVITLGDNVIYEGKVTGEGTPDIRTVPLDLGYYTPGQSRVMTVDIVWNDAGHGGMIDNGARIVDKNGVTVVRGKSGITHIEGEVIFKWIFSAAVEIPPDNSNPNPDNPDNPGGTSSGYDPENPDHPYNPINTGETVVFILFGVAVFAVAFMFILVMTRSKKKKSKK